MNCEQVSSELIAYAKSEIEPTKRTRIETHLAGCEKCRHELDQARRVLDWTEKATEEGVIRTVHQIIKSAIEMKGSDIHVEPTRNGELLVRIRVDGVLQEVSRLDDTMRTGVVSRIKMMADINVAETSVPQTGRIPIRIDEKDFDLRVSTVPFVHGEGIVLRILDRSNILVGLEALGLAKRHVESLRRIVHQPNGLVVVGGPTGSGKTTVLYSLALEVDRQASKVLSVEDPVEFLIDGVNQVQVSPRDGLTMASILRAFLRQDPDVIFCGDIPDTESARLAAEAALTGHLVLTQMHLESAVEAVQRLRDIGVPDYVIAGSMLAATCQRLVRKVCESCAQSAAFDASDPAIGYLGITADDARGANLRRPVGCAKCGSTGYRGRTALLEVLHVDRELKGLIGQGAPLQDLLESASSRGFLNMRDDAKAKVLEGITTADEAMRVLI